LTITDINREHPFTAEVTQADPYDTERDSLVLHILNL
jgi:hypothetical protein